MSETLCQESRTAPVRYYIGNLGAIDELDLRTVLLQTPWEQRVSARLEAFFADRRVAYTYGSGVGQRTYESWLYPDWLLPVREEVERRLGCRMELCFLNRYDNERHSLGWHSDDSPEVDPSRPIAVVSYGATREIRFRVIPDLVKPPEYPIEPTDDWPEERWLLGNASLLVMAPGMQQGWQHRIPKAPHQCGARVSLTFRGLTQ